MKSVTRDQSREAEGRMHDRRVRGQQALHLSESGPLRAVHLSRHKWPLSPRGRGPLVTVAQMGGAWCRTIAFPRINRCVIRVSRRSDATHEELHQEITGVTRE
jgi:hypothetical protein